MQEFPKVFPYQILKYIDLRDYGFNYIVFHKKLHEDMTPEFLDLIKASYKAIWANHLFVVYKKNPGKLERISAVKYVLYSGISLDKYYHFPSPSKTGIFLTTYNRPQALRRILYQLRSRKEEILVVNDGSSEKYREEYASVMKDFPEVTFIDNPKNMGLAFSLNTGFSYFLADPEIEWVHYFQDDVLIEDKDFFNKTMEVADKDEYPVVSGFYLADHPIHAKTEVRGIPVYLLRSISAQHFLVHRRYLEKNMPVPTPYKGAPKPDRGKPGQGSDTDWWLFSWSPHALIKHGKYIAVIPDLIQSDMAEDLSTWAGEGL